MELQATAPFDPQTEDESFWDTFPRRPAVFALCLKDVSGVQPPPYLSRTTDLRRRLSRLLATPHPNTTSPQNLVAGAGKSLSRPLRSRLLNLRELVSTVAYELVGSNFEARWLLYKLNRSYYPEVYRERLRLRPPTLLKINLKNRFPRCYPTRKLTSDGSLYYGPFASRVAAERFAAEFLDLFMIRRCVEDLNPDPAHPGCIYSQMRMCLAPCYRGCTDEEYQQELGRVIAFMDSEGQSLIRSLEAERMQASETLEFETAAKMHRKLDKVQEVVRLKPGLARNLADLNAVILQRGAEPKTVVFFRVVAGELCGPATLSLDERVASPVSLDQQIHDVLDTLVAGYAETGSAPAPAPRAEAGFRPATIRLPPWEHLSILARWYYSSFREGEILMLSSRRDIPHARIIRLCRKIITTAEG